MRWGEGHQKLPLYCEVLRALLKDQVQWIRDRQQARTITEENGRQSLSLACNADRLARQTVERTS